MVLTNRHLLRKEERGRRTTYLLHSHPFEIMNLFTNDNSSARHLLLARRHFCFIHINIGYAAIDMFVQLLTYIHSKVAIKKIHNNFEHSKVTLFCCIYVHIDIAACQQLKSRDQLKRHLHVIIVPFYLIIPSLNV